MPIEETNNADAAGPRSGPSGTSPAETRTLRLYRERATVGKRSVVKSHVSVERVTRTTEEPIELDLATEHVEIERVPIGELVERAPPIRIEGDTTILSIVEEVAVVERRLMLKEEVRITRSSSVRQHVETVVLREQDAVISRRDADRVAATRPTLPPSGESPTGRMQMTQETIVAVYDTPAHAELAVADLRSSGVPTVDISVHNSDAARGTEVSTATETTKQTGGFWSNLFGGEPDHDTAVYEQSVRGGSTVVSVRVEEEHAANVTHILETHHPIDIDERANRDGIAPREATVPTAPKPTAEDGGTMRLMEERLEVGKRVVNRGGTRIRRFVVETPVEENIGLHEEHVTMERHALDGSRPVEDADFSDRTIEMTESAEEAVVAKNAYLTEEISLRKESTDRVETVRDTVRSQQAEIERIPGDRETATPVKQPAAPKP